MDQQALYNALYWQNLRTQIGSNCFAYTTYNKLSNSRISQVKKQLYLWLEGALLFFLFVLVHFLSRLFLSIGDIICFDLEGAIAVGGTTFTIFCCMFHLWVVIDYDYLKI